jgi:hypothetical protein
MDNTMIDIQKLPQMHQTQDPLNDQLKDLISVANRLGLYDAADVVEKLLKNDKKNEKYGCHCKLEDDGIPDDCVIDRGDFDDCIYAHK